MAISTNATKLANLVNPQVMADLINKKLVNDIKFAPLATIDNTLVGRPGNTVTLPSYAYIGDASDVTEGGAIPIKQLTESTTTVTVSKFGNGAEITDEAILSDFGDTLGEVGKQIRLSIASALDNKMLTTLEGIGSGMTYTCAAAATADDIADSLVLFGEDIDGEKVLLVSPEQYAKFRKADEWLPASDVAASIVIQGTVGMIHGCQVVVSNRLKGKKEMFVVKPGALRIYMKRDVMVETDRDIINKTTVITADKHCVTYLYDASKAIKIKETIS